MVSPQSLCKIKFSDLEFASYNHSTNFAAVCKVGALQIDGAPVGQSHRGRADRGGVVREMT